MNKSIFVITIIFAINLACIKSNPVTSNPQKMPESLPHSMKGYELWDWQSNETSFFTLITGTNRIKTASELTSSINVVDPSGWVKLTATGIDSTKLLLSKIPEGEFLSFSGTVPGYNSVPSALIDSLKAYCLTLKISSYYF